MSKPAKRVLQGQVPQGVFFTSVELEHLKYKCLLDEQAFFFFPLQIGTGVLNQKDAE